MSRPETMSDISPAEKGIFVKSPEPASIQPLPPQIQQIAEEPLMSQEEMQAEIEERQNTVEDVVKSGVYPIQPLTPDFNPESLDKYDLRSTGFAIKFVDKETKADVAQMRLKIEGEQVARSEETDFWTVFYNEEGNEVGRIARVEGGQAIQPILEFRAGLNSQQLEIEVERVLRRARADTTLENPTNYERVINESPTILRHYERPASRRARTPRPRIPDEDMLNYLRDIRTTADLVYGVYKFGQKAVEEVSKALSNFGLSVSADYKRLWNRTFNTDETITNPEKLFQEITRIMDEEDAVGVGAYWREKPLRGGNGQTLRDPVTDEELYAPGSKHARVLDIIRRRGDDAKAARDTAQMYAKLTEFASYCTGPLDVGGEFGPAGRLLMENILDKVDEKWTIIENELGIRITGENRYLKNLNFSDNPEYVRVLRQHNINDTRGVWEMWWDANTNRQIPNGRVTVSVNDPEFKYKPAANDPVGEAAFKTMFGPNYFKEHQLGAADRLYGGAIFYGFDLAHLTGFRGQVPFFEHQDGQRPDTPVPAYAVGALLVGGYKAVPEYISFLGLPINPVKDKDGLANVTEGLSRYRKYADTLGYVKDRLSDEILQFTEYRLFVMAVEYMNRKDRAPSFKRVPHLGTASIEKLIEQGLPTKYIEPAKKALKAGPVRAFVSDVTGAGKDAAPGGVKALLRGIGRAIAEFAGER